MVTARLRKLAAFVVAGGTGFLVDAGLLWVGIHRLLLTALTARLLSFTVAMVTTWLLNRSITFADQRRPRPGPELVLYASATLCSGVANFGIYALAIAVIGTEGLRPFAALVLGVGVGMVSNFLLYNFVVFRPSPSANDHAASRDASLAAKRPPARS